ncbi:MAG: TRAP transporter substrate-binding protein DctP [Deltaproteobacteria bacterium]|nr:TRAP transporter substrate-binding protein DctP [Deltaproteobacteria bacterium]
MAPEGIGWANHIQNYVFPFIDEATEGELSVKVFWGGSVGDDEKAIQRMEQGVLDGAGLAGQGATILCPPFAVVELPFLFNDYEEVDYIREKMADTFDRLMAEKGYALLSWNDQDFDQVYSSAWPLPSLDQFARATFITWYGPLEKELLKILGAHTIEADVPEVSAAIRGGRADSAIGPALWVVGAQMYSTIKYINPMKIRYSPALIVVTLDSWKKLPEKYRRRILGGRIELNAKYCDEIRADNEKSIQAMVQYGLEVVHPSPEELSAIRKKAVTVWDQMVGTLYSRETLNEVLDHLEQYRAGR